MKQYILVSTAMVLLAGLLISCTNREMGTVGGAAVGGVVGNAVTGGSTGGTIVGAVGGGIIGNQLSR